jgi:hypothetical protein
MAGKYKRIKASSGSNKAEYLKRELALNTPIEAGANKELMTETQFTVFCATPIEHREYLVRKIFKL